MDNTRRFGRLVEGSNPSGGIQHMKKIFLAIFLITLFLPFTGSALGGSYSIDASGTIYQVQYEGLVPCGKCVNVSPPAGATIQGECDQTTGGVPVPIGFPISKKSVRCVICHIFVTLDGVIDFVLLQIVPAISTLLFIFAGLSYYQAMGTPEKLSKAKSLLFSVIIGLTIIYGSWIIINTAMSVLGLADWVGFGEGWFQIKCDLKTRGL